MKKSGRVSKATATANLMASFQASQSRRSLLKGAVAGATGVVIGAGTLSALPVQARVVRDSVAAAQTKHLEMFGSTRQTVDSIASILTVARTAEQLAVTFYSNGVANADKLGLSGDNLTAIKAALVEEQIHQQFFTANGGQSLADTFSFPQGPQTFTDLKTFIMTQQQLEGVFDSAFLAAIVEFGQLGRLDLSQIAGQIATIEAEHRALGRLIGGLAPADNWAFSPVLIATVGDAPALVKKAGYLSPVSGNSYTYQAVSTANSGVIYQKPFSVSAPTVGNG